MNNTIDIKLSKKELGAPGHLSELVVVPVFEGEEKTDDRNKLYDKEVRKFEIKALLTKNYLVHKTIDFKLDENEGNSYLILPARIDDKNVQYVKLYSTGGEYKFFRNANNELSLVKFECESKNSSEAIDKFFKGLTPYLDFLSYRHNVPIMIDKVSALDTKHQIQSVSYITPYGNVSGVLPPMGYKTEMIPIFSLFREAKSNPSYYYKFLCYFKILEGIYRKIRPNFMSRARKEGIKIAKKKDIVPNDSELIKFNKRYIGEPISKLFEDKFEREYRHAISHFSLRNGTILNLSDYKISSKFSSISLLIEICCGVVIDNQMELFEEYEQLSKKLQDKDSV